MTTQEQISGPCNGYGYGNQFRLANGTTWEQTSFIQEFMVSFGAAVALEDFGGNLGRLAIDGHSTSVEVRRVR